jgi:hypothetical protein
MVAAEIICANHSVSVYFVAFSGGIILLNVLGFSAIKEPDLMSINLTL